MRVVFATRQPQNYNLDLRNFIQFGASPRATINLTLASKAWALLQGRSYVTPQDIKAIGPDVLRHRIILTYERVVIGQNEREALSRRGLVFSSCLLRPQCACRCTCAQHLRWSAAELRWGERVHACTGACCALPWLL